MNMIALQALGLSARPCPALVKELIEPAAKAAASKVSSTVLHLPDGFASGPVESSFVSTAVEQRGSVPPVVLLHSFDSSCLEWRRVLPELEAAGLEAHALDILGWGFTDTTAVRSVSVEAKRAHLYAFWQQYLNERPAMFVGSSLGAAAIIDFASAHPQAVDSVVCLDPQAFIDGTPPVPSFAARGGVRLLRSWPLRSLGQKVAYEDGARCDTDDAIRVGRIHCVRDKWEDDAVEWLLGGGYRVSAMVPNLKDTRCLIMWGRQDRVLPPAENVPRFCFTLPDATFRWVEDCGHVPHLEQPKATAEAIAAFLAGDSLQGDGDYMSAASASGSPLERLDEFLDRPLLDTNIRGGPLEPFKQFARVNPEEAQVVASVVVLGGFFVLGRLLVGLAMLLGFL